MPASPQIFQDCFSPQLISRQEHQVSQSLLRSNPRITAFYRRQQAILSKFGLADDLAPFRLLPDLFNVIKIQYSIVLALKPAFFTLMGEVLLILQFNLIPWHVEIGAMIPDEMLLFTSVFMAGASRLFGFLDSLASLTGTLPMTWFCGRWRQRQCGNRGRQCRSRWRWTQRQRARGGA